MTQTCKCHQSIVVHHIHILQYLHYQDILEKQTVFIMPSKSDYNWIKFNSALKMSSSLSKILETGINVFKSNSRIIKNKKYYEISTLYTNASNTPFKINFNLMTIEFWVTSNLVAGQIWIKFIFLPVSSEDNCPLHIETMMPLPLVIYLWLCDVEMQASFCEQTKFYVFAEWTNFSKEL